MTDPRSEAIDRMTDWIEPVEVLREPTKEPANHHSPTVVHRSREWPALADEEG